MSERKEECGVAGIYLKPGVDKEVVPALLYEMLNHLQHRGQLAAGISTWNPSFPEKIRTYKDLGSVDEVFNFRDSDEREKILRRYQGIAGIGHVRYATSGSSDERSILRKGVQPFYRHHPRSWKRFAIAFNGNLANSYELREKFQSEHDYIFETDVDTEVIMDLISLSLKEFMGENNEKPNLRDISRNMMQELDGAYNILTLTADGDLYAIIDPHKIRPLVWGENDLFRVIASESVAFEKLDIRKKDIREVKKGHCMIFNRDGVREEPIFSDYEEANCHFEFVYFSKASSIVNGKSIKSVRMKLGDELAEIEPYKEEIRQTPDEWVVIAVPNTAITASEQFAYKLGIQSRSEIIKLSEDRGFINKTSIRDWIMSRAYLVMDGVIEGKKVFLVEDSFVRGETIKKIIGPVWEGGAKEIHLRSTEPPIGHICPYGINISNYEELLVNRFSTEEIESRGLEQLVAEHLRVTSFVYQKEEGLIRAIGKKELCLGCLDGKYLTSCGQKRSEEAREKWLLELEK